DAPPDSPPDAALLPDLQFQAAEMRNNGTDIDDQVFMPDDCAVVEGCVAEPGRRRLLHFSTRTSNRGTANLSVGVPPPMGQSNDMFQWSPCHMHHHYSNYVSYELVNATGVVATARKQAFCLEDDEQVVPGTSHGYTCLNQGISIGWADIYYKDLACQ